MSDPAAALAPLPRSAAALRKAHVSMPATLASRFIGFHPAEGIIIDTPEVLAFMAGETGVFDASVTPSGAIRYPDEREVRSGDLDEKRADGDGAVCVDAERVIGKLVSQVQTAGSLAAILHADFQTVIRFLRGFTHGAIRRGLSITTKAGHRELYVSGGVVSLFEQGEGGEHLVNRTILRDPSEPLPFLVVAGDAAILDANGAPVQARQVPTGKAWVPGSSGRDSLVDAEPKTYRVDLLGVEPTRDGVQWYLFLGTPSTVTDKALAGGILAPEIPDWARDALLPIARITTCHNQKGIAAVEVVAPRFNGV